MVIDLKRFFQAEGAEDRFRRALDFSGVELGGAKPFCAPVEIQARLKSFAGAVSFLVQADFVMAMPCDRCAEEFTREYHKEFAHTLVRESEGAEDDEDLILVPEEKLDVDRLILEDILLDLPGQFLCREDCQGLCSSCGKNLNQGPCGCGGQETDPRLEVLRQLL